MTRTGGIDDFMSSELRATVKQIRKIVLATGNTQKINRSLLSVPKINVTNTFIDEFSATVRTLNSSSATALSDSVKRLYGTTGAVGEALRVSAEARAKIMPPQLEQSLAAIKAVTTKYYGASGTNVGAAAPGPSIVADVAQATGFDAELVTSVHDQLAKVAEDDLEADEVLAPARDAKLAELTPDQAEATRQFLNRWLWNFDFDHTVLSAVFGDAYLLDVLHWAVVLAVIQALLVPMLLPARMDEDEDEK